ncbi:MAG: hypothetical protein CMB45_05550 [Euryarchaeota archaeon]|nr:hypothetical protein [Euryarchaeota archaeon]MBK38439.1 hypothetical protein [Euryarchaeota archaeon]
MDIENPEDILVRMTVALERCADALDTIAGKPAWVKVAEERLSEVNEMRKTAVEAVVELEAKRTNENPTPTPAPVVESNDDSLPPSGIDVGMRVRVSCDDDPRKDGLVGTIVKRTNAWATLKADDGKTTPVRPKDCILLEGETENPPEELVVEEVVEEPVFEPSDDATAPENYVIEGGVHNGKTLHILYNESPRGKQFVKWLAKSEVKGQETTSAAQAYLKSQGESWT